MNLLVDIGNTRLKIARTDAGALLDAAALSYDDADFALQLGSWLDRVPASSATHAWIAPVAPDQRGTALRAELARRDVVMHEVATQASALGVRIAYAEPARLGVDRWLTLLAARARSASPALIVSVGSALTIDALLGDGQHLGGLIVAPPEAMRTALIARAPKLDVGRGEVTTFARNTEDAIESGATLAAAALIERSLHELERRAQYPPRLLLCGGGAPGLRDWLPPHEFAPQLVLEGLARWADAH